MSIIYLDNAATTPVDPRVKEAMLPWLSENWGNASSVHSPGRKAKVMIEDTRDMFAAFIGARSSEIYFTSGGTEAINFAIKGSAFHNIGRKSHIIASSIEHSAVIDTLEYLKKRFAFEVTYLQTDRFGKVNTEEFENAIKPSTFLACIMHSNNELGIINDIPHLAGISASKNITFFSDAVQSLGKTTVNMGMFNCGLASFSGHKIYGPKGIGILYIKKNTNVDKFMHGGKQERDKRGGTENTAAIAGFAKAVEIIKDEMPDDLLKYKSLRTLLISLVKGSFGDKIIINSVTSEKENTGSANAFLPNIINLSFEPDKVNIDADTLLIKLDMKHIAVSSGSACTSGSVQPSHVLKAIGYDDKTARSSLRISFGRFNTENDIKALVNSLKEILN
jgi:cysteine desulfurase